MADILVTGQEAYFNEDAKFFKDVYVYGNLYAVGAGGDGGNFTGSVNIPGNLYVSGISTFIGTANFEDLKVKTLTVTKKLDVGIGGTTLSASVDTGNIGIGITVARQKLDVIGSALFSDKVGIGSTVPEQSLDVIGNVKFSSQLYDSTNSPGVTGAFLTKDGSNGVHLIP